MVYRSCDAEWFKSWSWLHYEEGKDAVLCHVCTRAVREGKMMSGNAEPAFVNYSPVFETAKTEDILLIYMYPEDSVTGRMVQLLFAIMRRACATRRPWRRY